MTPDVQNRLLKYMDDAQKQPLRWGRNDCILFAMNGLEKAFKEDFGMDNIRGCYDGPRSAFKFMSSLPGEDFVDVVGKWVEAYGFVEVGEPQFGDLACIRVENVDPVASELFGGMTFSLVCLPAIVIAAGKEGAGFVNDFEYLKLWRYEDI